MAEDRPGHFFAHDIFSA